MIVARTIFQFPRTPISVSFIPKRYKRNSKKDGSLKDGVTQIAEQIKGKPIDTKIDALVEDILSNKDGIKSLLDVFRGGKNTSDLFASIGADLQNEFTEEMKKMREDGKYPEAMQKESEKKGKPASVGTVSTHLFEEGSWSTRRTMKNRRSDGSHKNERKPNK
eukprot:TRINITY_DN2916_c0_g1_i11.p1 TRINITY_DN2916_c0_g1~~TRINITY_DN2916_c0_g1_i11.p1  ORF type:complete len:163 (-),score=11.94 TRINITY_DN2916_c0_g1_i11:132-620(-)